MNTPNCVSQRSACSDLRRIVEPLANYVCAADKPKTALFSALAVLVSEVEGTNRAATAHFRTYLENH